MGVIIETMFDEQVMNLEFGSALIRFIGRNTVAPVVTKVYRAAFVAIRKHEPEYRPARVQLLRLDGTGVLALGFDGLYFPEGRFGNYAISQRKGEAFPLQAAAILGQAA